MAKVQRATLLKSIVSTEIYQSKQGKVLRRTTAGAIWLACVLACQALYHSFMYEWGDTGLWIKFVPESLATMPVAYWFLGVLILLSGWVAYRAVNYPVFADFLIDVESEMTKVTWPSWLELQRATTVVLVTMLIFSVLLLGYDVFWQGLLKLTGVLRLTS